MSRSAPDDPSDNPDAAPADAGAAAGGASADTASAGAASADAGQADSVSPAQRHDAFFKAIFADPANAAPALRAILPPRVAAHIDWDSLEPVHASMVGEQLQQRHGDLLFRARLVDGRSAFVWLLFEHQSTVDWWMSWRMAGMIFDFLRDWLGKHPEARYLPAVLPIILHQGPRPWRAATSLLELADLSDEARGDFAGYLLSLRCVLDDLRAVADDALDARPLGPLPRLTLGVMKHYKSRRLVGFLIAHASDMRTLFASEHGRFWLFRLLSYTWSVNPYYDRATLLRHLTPVVGPELQQTMLTFDELLGKESFDRGRDIGKVQGKREVLLRQLARRFGALPESVEARVNGAGADDIERWSDRILDAASLDAVFAR
jgi:Putative transposase, YhgA-like/Domain of unknown function (DUF4351)